MTVGRSENGSDDLWIGEMGLSARNGKTSKPEKLKMFSVWPKNQPKTTEIDFSHYFHFNSFPPLSHTHEPLTHALLCQAFTAPTHTPSQTEPPTPTHHDPSSTQPSSVPLRSAHDSTQPSSDPLRGPVTIQAWRTWRKSFRSAHDPSSTHSTKITPIHSDPLTIQDPIHSTSETKQAPIHSKHLTKIAPIHSDPSSDSVDAHGEFSFSVSHSDPLIFLRSTLISPVHSFSISGRQPHFSDPQIITSVLTPTHCDASSLLLFLLLLYINFLGLWL